MSKKHFIALADAFRRSKPLGADESTGITYGVVLSAEADQWKADVAAVADVCKSANRDFNRERWMDYIHGLCGPSGGKPKVAV